jgi:hypothetical protein
VVQQNRQGGQLSQVSGVGVDLDLDAIGCVPARCIEEHMSAGDEEEPILALEKEPAGAGQTAASLEGEHTGDTEQGLVQFSLRRRPGVEVASIEDCCER